MYRAAFHTFYLNVHLNLRHDNLGAILRFLPPTALPVLRHVTLTLSAAQCYYWFGHAPDTAYPPRYLTSVAAELYPPGDNRQPGPPPVWADSYRSDFRAVLALLAGHTGLPRLELELDLTATYRYAKKSEYNTDWRAKEELYRWTYDLYLDIAEAVCALADSLRIVRFRLGTFTDLEPWLEREVLGERFSESAERSVGEPATARQEDSRIPEYHQINQRLKGSNYRKKK